MIEDSKLYRIISYVHINVLLSLSFTILNFLTLGYALLPGLMALMHIAEDMREGTFDIHGSYIRGFLKSVKQAIKIKYILFHSVLLLNILGLIVAAIFKMKVSVILSFSVIVVILSFYCLYAFYYNETSKEDIEGVLVFAASDFKVMVAIITMVSLYLLSHLTMQFLFLNNFLIFTYVYGINLLFNYSKVRKDKRNVINS